MAPYEKNAEAEAGICVIYIESRTDAMVCLRLSGLVLQRWNHGPLDCKGENGNPGCLSSTCICM